MVITSRTRYITNGKVYARLGYYRKNEDKKGGTFYNCRRWPENDSGVTFLHNRPGPSGSIPMSWIRTESIFPPFLEGFIGIQERLIPKHILEKLNHYS